MKKWLALVVLFFLAATMQAQTVKVTPLGGAAGEFSAFDRALLFEDPTGVRILYDPGPTVPANDPRLGDVHVILISHAHGDHLGSAPGIAANKNSAVIVSFIMANFLRLKIQTLRGSAVDPCPPTFFPSGGLGNEMTVPRTSPCTGWLGISGKRTVTMAAGTPGVQISLVPAVHDNSVDPGLLSDPLKTELQGNSLAKYLDPATGYVVKFTNGLTVYLSGDTGLMSDMDTIIREFYGPNLVVINIGDIFTTGPDEAAFAVNRLIKPKGAQAQILLLRHGSISVSAVRIAPRTKLH